MTPGLHLVKGSILLSMCLLHHQPLGVVVKCGVVKVQQMRGHKMACFLVKPYISANQACCLSRDALVCVS